MVLTDDRIVSPTDAAVSKEKDKQISTESVFSALTLPCSFYRSFLKAHSVQAVLLGMNNISFLHNILFRCAVTVRPTFRIDELMRLDLASGQGELAKACLAERVPYMGLTLSESHSTQLELILTNFAVTLMQTEGSTYYRAAAKRKSEGEGNEDEPPKAKAKAKGKAKGKPKAKPTPEAETDAQAEEPEADNDDEEVQLPW